LLGWHDLVVVAGTIPLDESASVIQGIAVISIEELRSNAWFPDHHAVGGVLDLVAPTDGVFILQWWPYRGYRVRVHPGD